MSVMSARKSDFVLSVPNIRCPECGRCLRLATVELKIMDDEDRMTFDCECGFDYRLSERAARGR
jgi:lysyl-tRNA synthetase class I